ncbi:hypothetical protein EMIHUDRAFT_68578, partial [Emiliania huxleyi CCMP1516]|uniref:Protein kinase domain-containing protein n=2 Tax=Emiliania huxleyi TaxID=2903 RepID=A0A0D3I6Q8_EMIH1
MLAEIDENSPPPPPPPPPFGARKAPRGRISAAADCNSAGRRSFAPSSRRQSLATTGTHAAEWRRARRQSEPLVPLSAAADRARRADPLSEHGYTTLGPIASGAFSMIVRARHSSTGRQVAVKSFSKARCSRSALTSGAMRAEVEALLALRPSAHAHVANLIERCVSLTSISLMLEYCAGGSLQRRLASHSLRRVGLDEVEARAVASQLGRALSHLHRLGVAHRDVKPENVLYTDGSHATVKLCDFGFAKAPPAPPRLPRLPRPPALPALLHTVCGSPQYMAPEISSTGDGYRGPPVDMWALGALVYELLHAQPAFRASTLPQLSMRIQRGAHQPLSTSLSPRARAVVKKLLLVDPSARLSAHSLIEQPWLDEQHLQHSQPP